MCQTMISKRKNLQIPKINYKMEEKNMKEYDFEEKKLADSEDQLQDGRSAKVVHSPEILTH